MIFWYFRPRSIKMWRMAMKKEHLADWTSHEICPHNRQKSHCLWHDVQVSLKFCSFVQISYKIPVSWIRSKTWCSNTCQQPYYWISSGPLSTVYVVAISFYAAFGVITSNNAPQIDCLFTKADTRNDKDTFHHTLFSVNEAQSGPCIHERQYFSSPIFN